LFLIPFLVLSHSPLACSPLLPRSPHQRPPSLHPSFPTFSPKSWMRRFVR
jgi:hypothetical protein